MAVDLVVVSRQSVAAIPTVSLRYGRSCHAARPVIADRAPLPFLHNVTVLTLDYNINLGTFWLRLGPKPPL